MIPVVMYVAKKTIAAAVGIPAAVAVTASAIAVNYKKKKKEGSFTENDETVKDAEKDAWAGERSFIGKKLWYRARAAEGGDTWAEDHRQEYLSLGPVKDHSFIGMKILYLLSEPDTGVTIKSHFAEPLEVLPALELIRKNGSRQYLFYKEDPNLFLKERLINDVIGETEFENNCFYSPDEVTLVYRGLAKVLPGFGSSNIVLDADCDYFMEPPHFQVDKRALNEFVSGETVGDIRKAERNFLKRTYRAWEANSMLQLLGRETYEPWRKRMDEVFTMKMKNTEKDRGEKEEDFEEAFLAGMERQTS